MKAIMCKEFAPVKNLSWEEVPDPVPGDNEIVVDVKAAGLNYPTISLFEGFISLSQSFPSLRGTKVREL